VFVAPNLSEGQWDGQIEDEVNQLRIEVDKIVIVIFNILCQVM